jgi:hypothetical protein
LQLPGRGSICAAGAALTCVLGAPPRLRPGTRPQLKRRSLGSKAESHKPAILQVLLVLVDDAAASPLGVRLRGNAYFRTCLRAPQRNRGFPLAGKSQDLRLTGPELRRRIGLGLAVIAIFTVIVAFFTWNSSDRLSAARSRQLYRAAHSSADTARVDAVASSASGARSQQGRTLDCGLLRRLGKLD